MVSFLTRIIIERRLRGDLFSPTEAIKKSVQKEKRGAQVTGKKSKRAVTRE